MSFEIALSGINAVNSQLDTISNNIANAGTYGFKSSRANFASMYAGSQATGAEVSSMTQSIDIGGSVLTTGRGLDAAIQGRGFFTAKDASGAMLYTRVGVFSTDKNGFIIDSAGRKLQGYPVLPGSTALGVLGDLTVPTGQVPAQASSRLHYVGNLSSDWTAPAVATFDKGDPQSFNSSMVSMVYDSLGSQHSVTQYFVKTATNEVTVHYTFDGADLAATTTLQFGSDGQLLAPTAAVPLTLGTPAGAAALTVNLDYSGSTQFAGEANTTVNAPDGYASGTLTGLQLSDDGSIMAQYSNGQKQSLGKVALATFPNEGALVSVSDSSWTTSNESGLALYATPGSGLAGTLTAGALEQSNVDMTAELVNLMGAQRNYQANTRIISTESELMQALMQAV